MRSIKDFFVMIIIIISNKKEKTTLGGTMSKKMILMAVILAFYCVNAFSELPSIIYEMELTEPFTDEEISNLLETFSEFEMKVYATPTFQQHDDNRFTVSIDKKTTSDERLLLIEDMKNINKVVNVSVVGPWRTRMGPSRGTIWLPIEQQPEEDPEE